MDGVVRRRKVFRIIQRENDKMVRAQTHRRYFARMHYMPTQNSSPKKIISGPSLCEPPINKPRCSSQSAPVPSSPFLEVEAFFDHRSDCPSCNKTRDTFQLIYRTAKSQLLKQLCTSKGKLVLSRQIKKLRRKEDWNGNETTVERTASKVLLGRIFDLLVQKHELLVTSNNLLLCKSCSSDHQSSVPENLVMAFPVSEDGICSDDSDVSMQVLRTSKPR